MLLWAPIHGFYGGRYPNDPKRSLTCSGFQAELAI
jgi:hypothetical protein